MLIIPKQFIRPRGSTDGVNTSYKDGFSSKRYNWNAHRKQNRKSASDRKSINKRSSNPHQNIRRNSFRVLKKTDASNKKNPFNDITHREMDRSIPTNFSYSPTLPAMHSTGNSYSSPRRIEDAVISPPVLEEGKTSSNRDWEIESVMYGISFKSDRKNIVSRRWYASSDATARVDRYWQIDEESLSATALLLPSRRSFHYRTKVIVPSPANADAPAVLTLNACRETRMDARKQLESFTLQSIKAFCRRYPGVAVLLNGTGAREPNPDLKPFHLHGTDVMIARSEDFDCVPAATASAIGIICGGEGFKRACEVWSKTKLHLSNLGQAGPVLFSMGLSLKMKKPSNLLQQLRSSPPNTGIEIVSNLRKGVWLVRLFQSKGHRVDHCVVVDAWNQMIVDSEEEHPIALTAQSLRMCGGKSCANLKIIEIIEIIRKQ